MSYSCTENVGKIIKTHNKKLSLPPTTEEKPCNCKVKTNCPLNNNCKTSSVIYKCEVTTPNTEKKVYIGLTEGEFKQRYNNHKQSFTNKKYANSTTLSTHVWKLKESNKVTPTLNWSIVRHVNVYSNASKKCSLCLEEKLQIMEYPNKNELLNKRTEIISKCRHMNKFLLANYKSKKD